METPEKQPKFRRGPGRPSKFTKEIEEKILSFIRVGAYIETAAAAAGISKDTFYHWLKQGERLRAKVDAAVKAGLDVQPLTSEQRRLTRFSDAVEKAAAESELMDLTTIKKASSTNWQAAAWRLERKNPEKWGRRDFVRQEVSGPGGDPVKSEVVTIPGGLDRVAHAYKEKIRRELLAEMKKGTQ